MCSVKSFCQQAWSLLKSRRYNERKKGFLHHALKHTRRFLQPALRYRLRSSQEANPGFEQQQEHFCLILPSRQSSWCQNPVGFALLQLRVASQALPSFFPKNLVYRPHSVSAQLKNSSSASHCTANPLQGKTRQTIGPRGTWSTATFNRLYFKLWALGQGERI